MSAPAALHVRGPDGTSHTIVQAGGPLPASGRVVTATTRAGQDALELELVEEGAEGGPKRVAMARFALPRGLPANTWIPVEVQVSAELRVRAEAREQLRRIRVAGVFDASGRTASHFSA